MASSVILDGGLPILDEGQPLIDRIGLALVFVRLLPEPRIWRRCCIQPHSSPAVGLSCRVEYNATMSNELIPTDYQQFLQTIKTRIQQAQLQALVAVNRELILLYWHMAFR